MRGVAMGATLGHLSRISAVVALHTRGGVVERQRDIAVRASHSPAAVTARYKWRESTSILKQHYLLASLQGIAYGVEQRMVEMNLSLTTFYCTYGI